MKATELTLTVILTIIITIGFVTQVVYRCLAVLCRYTNTDCMSVTSSASDGPV